jgi:hypothetical protein
MGGEQGCDYCASGSGWTSLAVRVRGLYMRASFGRVHGRVHMVDLG